MTLYLTELWPRHISVRTQSSEDECEGGPLSLPERLTPIIVQRGRGASLRSECLEIATSIIYIQIGTG